MGNTHSKISSDSSPGHLLHNLTKLGLKDDLKTNKLHPFFHTSLATIWPSKWPDFGTFGPNILQDLDNFIVRNGNWIEASYLQAFFYLKSQPSLCSNCSPLQVLLDCHPSPSASAPNPLPSTFDPEPANEPPP
jgi:hypothetical protein